MRRLGEDVLRGHLDELGERAVVREAEDAVLLAGFARVVAPVERRVDDHLGALVRSIGALAAGADLAGAVRAQDGRQRLGLRARVLAPGYEDVAAVEGCGVEPDDRLAGTWLGVGSILVAELVGTTKFVQHHRFHEFLPPVGSISARCLRQLISTLPSAAYQHAARLRQAACQLLPLGSNPAAPCGSAPARNFR